ARSKPGAQIGLQLGLHREIAPQGLHEGGVKGLFLVHRLLFEHALVQEGVILQNPETEAVNRGDGGTVQRQQGVAQPTARSLVDEPAFLVGRSSSGGVVSRKMAKLAQLLAEAQAKLGSGALSESDDQDLLHARVVIEQQFNDQVLEQEGLASAGRRLDHGMPRAELIELRRSGIADDCAHAVSACSKSK